MIITSTNKEVETNICTGTQFKVTENSAKLFSMLSSFIYSDKEGAVMHEICANALDAHVAAGKADVPFEVIMPTTLEPTLTIRDFGNGLSHENVIKFLTTYGESDKQGTNNQIGGYGIGSKAPACVTDTWDIISCHKGVFRQYVVLISSDGIPSLNMIRETTTSETGLTVRIPVNPSSIYSWHAKLGMFKYYATMPIIKNVSANSLPTPFDVKDSTDDYLITGSNDYMEVVSGVRRYPLNFGNLQKEELYNRYSAMRGVILKFNIGELDLDLSRENLQYTKKTKEAIISRINHVFDKLKEDIAKEFSTVENDELAYRRAIMSSNFPEMLLNAYLKESKKYDITHQCYANRIKLSEHNVSGLVGHMFFQDGKNITNKKFSIINHWFNHITREYFNYIDINCLDSVKFYRVDTKQGHLDVKALSKVESDKTHVVLYDGVTLTKWFEPNVMLTSTVPKRPKAIRTKTVKRYPRIEMVDMTPQGNLPISMEEAEKLQVESGKKAIFIELKRFNSQKDVPALVSEMRMQDYVVFGVRNFNGIPSWGIKFNDSIKDVLTESYRNLINDNFKSSIKQTFEHMYAKAPYSTLYDGYLIEKVDKSSLWYKMYEKLQGAKKYIDNTVICDTLYSNIQRITDLASSYGVKIDCSTPDVFNVDEVINVLDKEYPLLKYIIVGNRSASDETKDAIMQYVINQGVK